MRFQCARAWILCRLVAMLAVMSDVTRILSKIEFGDPSAAEGLLPLIYDELRALAAAKMADESPDNTLQATALVHEAYIRLVDVDQAQHWNSRGHFFGAAAEAMRRILVESARRKGRQRRAGSLQRCDLAEEDLVTYPIDDELLDLDAAITRLGKVDAEGADLVKMRLFAGMTGEEVAQLLGISERTARRMWVYARAWLGRELHF